MAAACLVACGLAAGAIAASDEVTAAEDSPPGCETAGFGGEQCGAQGRNNFNDASHKPPIELCKHTPAASGSVVTRILPNGPRRPDGSLAFISGACVYLPPGYNSGTVRYPVVYLLHGGGGDQGNWVSPGGIQKMLDDFYAADASRAVIAVMPDGNDGNWHDYRDGSFLIEQYVLHHLVPYVDRHFRTIADRRGRAIAGLSNGGYGALHLAAKAPDMFVAAGAMSSNVGGRGMDGLGTPWFPGGPDGQEAGAFYYGNVPTPLASNLDNVDVTMDLGASCSSDVSVDLCATLSVDLAFKYDNEAFRDAMVAAKHQGAFEFRETEGSHAWRWWSKWLRERHLPFMWQRLAKPQPVGAAIVASPLPVSFRYRSVAPAFSIYGYDVAITRPHPEFLDLTEVSAGGLTITGTGAAVVVTAPRYKPGAGYVVTIDGKLDQVVNADNAGRLRFAVDLGPGHADEQYSPAARALEAAGQYKFVTRKVRLAEIPVVIPVVLAEELARTGSPAVMQVVGALLLVLALAAARLRVAAAGRAA